MSSRDVFLGRRVQELAQKVGCESEPDREKAMGIGEPPGTARLWSSWWEPSGAMEAYMKNSAISLVLAQRRCSPGLTPKPGT